MRRGRGPLLPLLAGAVLLAASWVSGASAQAQADREFQGWSAIFLTASPQAEGKRLAFWADLHMRRGEQGTIFLLRPGVGMHLLPWLSVWAGYAWIPSIDDPSGTVFHEHRLWQQLLLSDRIAGGRLLVQARTRFEQRFGEGSGQVGLRARQFVRANWSPVAGGPWGLALWDELFVGLDETDWGAPAGLDQNRLFVGPFLEVPGRARLEVGYLFVYLDRATDLLVHALSFNLLLSLQPERAPAEEADEP